MAFALEHFPTFPHPPGGMQEVEEIERYLTSLHRSMQEFFSLLPRDIKDGISVVDLDDLANTTLADPDADRIVFWDDGAGVYTWLTANTGLAISTTNLNLSHLGIEALADPSADRIAFWDNSESAFKWLACDGTTIDITTTTLAVIAGGVDHGGLAGLGDDDHTQYLLVDGTRAMTGDLDMGSNNISNAGHIGLGNSADDPNYAILYSGEVLTDTDNTPKAGAWIHPAVAKTSAAFTSWSAALFFACYLDSTNTQNWTNAIGIRGVTGHITGEGDATGTITGAANFHTWSAIADAATFTNLYGLYIETPTVSGNKVTNEYGIYIDDQNTGATLNYAIYTGAGLVHFGDNITGGTYNALTLASVATGFTIAGGTSSKTLTLDENFVATTQLTAIGNNTTHRGSVGTDHGYIDQDLQVAATPTFAGLALSSSINFTGAAVQSVGHSVDNQGIYIEGGSAVTYGASLQFFGEDHASYPGSAYIISGSHDATPASVIEFAYRSSGSYQAIMTLGNDRHIDIWDYDDSAMRDISFGADDSGGEGYKVLRVPN